MKVANYITQLVFLTIVTCILIILYHFSNVNDLKPLKSFKAKETIVDQEPDLKYILLWTNPSNSPFVYMGNGQKGFIDRGCPHTNCYVTSDRDYLNAYTNFDAIAFAGPEVVRLLSPELPKRRSPHQRYVFASIESSGNYPVCSNRFDDFFNWTWTYKLSSEIKWGYIVIRNLKNEIIGPRTDMQWMRIEDMQPISKQFRRELRNKTKAAAWFVSNCYSKSEREKFVKKLQFELYGYGLLIDIFGDCGFYQCSRDMESECNLKIQQNYYFYLSFENSFSEDYVTEKLLRALNNNAVPIVFGGANYTRFMPDGIYLNAVELGVKKLAAKMNELIRNPEMYQEYFKWKNHYKYDSTSQNLDTNEYCKMCSVLNDEQVMKQTNVYEHFHEWWDPSGICPQL